MGEARSQWGSPTSSKGWRLAWVSERVIVAMKPGNAGGAKDPYFGCVSEEGKETVKDTSSGKYARYGCFAQVIDDESSNTR